MKWIYRAILIFAIPFFLPEKSFALQYELLINSSAPTMGTIRLIFEDALHTETRLISRQLKESNIKNPICSTSGKTLPPADGGGWIVPAGCSEIIWGIQFIEVDRPNHDVSAQENLYYPGKWWLFSEWGNLLRLASNTAESEICTKDRATCRHVPSSKEAPLLMLVGEPSKQVTSGETSFNFFSGHLPEAFDIKNLYGSYEQQLSYLQKVITPVNPSTPPQTVDVLVLGIDASLGVIGGAAGKDAYLANIAGSERGVISSDRIKYLWVAGHEMAHMLGLGTEALWASESLAHYYGFKSLGEDKLASQIFKQMVGEMSQIGLLKAQQLVGQGEGQHYAQFYVKGAAFWKDLDEAIIGVTRSQKSLDDYLSLLINGRFGTNGELPSEFLEAMVDVIGQEKVNRLLLVYL